MKPLTSTLCTVIVCGSMEQHVKLMALANTTGWVDGLVGVSEGRFCAGQYWGQYCVMHLSRESRKVSITEFEVYKRADSGYPRAILTALSSTNIMCKPREMIIDDNSEGGKDPLNVFQFPVGFVEHMVGNS